ncbi:MAG: hypothetical protein IJZ57_07510 [Clostridia bacterium]|nr:hypothetical protein [Clostridia bacterium]
MKIVFNKQHVFAFTVAYMLSFLALLNLGNEIFNLFGMVNQLDTIVLYGLLVGLVVLGIFLTFNDRVHFKLDILCVVVFLAVAFVVTYVLFPENVKYLFTSWTDFFTNPIYILFIYTLPGFAFARQLKDYEFFNYILRIFSYITVTLSVIVFFFAKGSSASQYMTFSYNMLTQLFFLILHEPQKYKAFHYIVVILGMFAFAFGGARGAMLSLIIAGLIFYFMTYKPTKKNVLTCTVIVTIGVAIALFKSSILIFISDVLDRLLIDSRTFRYLATGEIFDDSNRFQLYETSIDNIGILGKGIMGDRVILGYYSHNLFLELLVQFGLLLGILLIGVICGCVISAILKKDRPEYIYIILLLPCGFLKLMITGSYLHQEPAFYILLGLCLNSILRSNDYANTYDKYSIRTR